MSNSPSKNRSIPGAGAEQFAELFHATYERLAPEFGYTTRTDTRRFDRGSHNGKLMIAVCDYLLTWLDEEAPAEIERLRSDLARVVIANAEVANLNAEQAETIERLRAAMWKYGKHLSACTIHTTRIPAHSCSCGWSQIRETLPGEAKRPAPAPESRDG